MKQAVLATAHDTKAVLEQNEYYLRSKFWTEVAMIMVNTYKGAQRFQIGQELIATGAFVEGTTGGITTAASGVAVAVGGALICDSVSKVGLVAQATKIATGDYDKLKRASKSDLIKKLVGKVPDKFKKVFMCKEFRDTLVGLLKKNGIHGKVIEVKGTQSDLIFSDKYGGVISKNGVHYGVKIDDMIYDNMNPEGISYDLWKKDLAVGNTYGISADVIEEF